MFEIVQFVIGSFFIFIQQILEIYPKIDRNYYNIEVLNVEEDEDTSEIQPVIKKCKEIEINKIIMSYNIHRGFNSLYEFKLNDMIDFIDKNNSGIVCLQEIQDQTQYEYIKHKLNYKNGVYSNHKCILTNYNIVNSDAVKYTSLGLYDYRDYLHCVLTVNDVRLNVINIHLTNDITGFKQNNEKKEMLEYIYKNNLDNIILIGDTNCVDYFDHNDKLNMLKKWNLPSTFPSYFPFLNFDKAYTKNVDMVSKLILPDKLSDHMAISYVFNIK